MSTKFIHTADWQLGKPFARVEDVQKRSLIQNERLAVIERIGKKAKEHGSEFVLVAGDLFDSPNATKSTVSAAFSAIGSIGLPVFAIPGNHDFYGPGSLWSQAFFLRERDELAPDFRILSKPEPVELDSAVLFPCPLLRRREPLDTTAWLRSLPDLDSRWGDKCRIVLAHGSVQNFGAQADEEDGMAEGGNILDLERLDPGAFDYIALGDWHGTKQVGPKAWYSGTPELDRFIRGEANVPGNVLQVTASRGQPPSVDCQRTGALEWHELSFAFADDTGLARLKEEVDEKAGNRAFKDLLWLHLSGSLGIEASAQLETQIVSWQARLLRVKLDNQTSIAPTAAEIQALAQRPGDPLISRVAAKLSALASGGGSQAAVSRIALRVLYSAINSK